MMDLAVRTTASPTAIWVIVIVMSICTGILVSAAGIADSRQARASRRRAGVFSLESTSAPAGTAAMDAGAGPPAPGEQASGPMSGRAPAGEPVPAPRSGGDTAGQPGPARQAPGLQPTGRHARPESDPTGEAPTLPDMPPVTGRHAMPAQRAGDADQAERSYRATGPADGDHPDQS